MYSVVDSEGVEHEVKAQTILVTETFYVVFTDELRKPVAIFYCPISLTLKEVGV